MTLDIDLPDEIVAPDPQAERVPESLPCPYCREHPRARACSWRPKQ